MTINFARNLPIFIFLLLSLFVSLFIYKDYGIGWDEQRERKSGALAAIYINSQFNYAFISKEAVKQKLSDQNSKAVTIIKNDVDYSDPKNYLTYEDKDYGVVFTLILTAVEVAFNAQTSQEIYQLRHLTINLFFLISLFFLYQVIWFRFKDWRIALLGPLFMILSPVIFAHSFFNPKDIPLMAVYTCGLYTLIRFLKRKNYSTAILHSLSCAVLIDMRIPGIILPAVTIGFLVLDVLFDRNKSALLKKLIPVALVYVALMLVFIVAFWPYLWTSPVANFIAAFNNMKKFRWSGEVLFFGEYIEVAKHVPWYYVPGWIMINTPLLYLLGILTTIIIIFKKVIKKGIWYYKTEDGKFNIIALATFLMPLLAIIVLNSVLYNGWRQVYFIYPPLIVLSVCGIVYLHQYVSGLKLKVAAFILPALVIVCISLVALNMYRIHPFQNVYFNLLAGKNIEERFECDYWAVSFRKNLEYILQHDRSDAVLVFVEDPTPAKVNSLALPEESKKRLIFTETMGEANYFITKYDRAKSRKEFLVKKNLKEENEVYAAMAGDIKLSSTFKLK